jgi:hypothetical protein
LKEIFISFQSFFRDGKNFAMTFGPIFYFVDFLEVLWKKFCHDFGPYSLFFRKKEGDLTHGIYDF